MAITNKAKKAKKAKIDKIIKKWTSMLTSGDYKKTTGALHKVGKKTNKHSYCCLGVLCELAVKEGVLPKKYVSSPSTFDGEIEYAGNSGELPDKVRQWAGLRDSLGAYTAKNNISTSLASVNDSGKKSFTEIAALIASRPKGLFVD